MAFQANGNLLYSYPLDRGQEQKERTIWINQQGKALRSVQNGNSSSKHDYLCGWTTLKCL